jgi:hypothetical protein
MVTWFWGNWGVIALQIDENSIFFCGAEFYTGVNVAKVGLEH